MVQRNTFFTSLRGLLLVAAAGTWIGGIFLDSLLPLSLPAPILLIGAAVLLALILVRRDVKGRLILLLLASTLLGAWRYTIALPTNDPQAVSAFIGQKNITIHGVVVDEPKFQGHSRLLLVDASTVQTSSHGSRQDVHGRLEVLTLGIAIESLYGANYGDTIELRGTLQTASAQHTPGVFASMTFPRISVLSKGNNTPLAYLYHLRVQCATLLTQILPQPQASLLIALFLSLRTPALSSIAQDFNVTGTAHLIAPSGFKVTVIAGLITASTRWLYEGKKTQEISLLPAQRRRDWRRWLATCLAIIAITLYTALSGFVPAAFRAGLMGSVLLIGPRIGRMYNVYTALALSALLLSLFDPFVLGDVGFQLSFLGTLGIVVLTPLFQRLLQPLVRLPFGHQLVEIISVTLAAQTATLPIIAITFQNISFVAPLANILTVPLLGVFLLAGMVLCILAFCALPVALICGWAIYPLLTYMVDIVHWCAQLPGAYLVAPGLSTTIAWAYYGVLFRLLINIRKFIVPVPKRMHVPWLSTRNWRIVQGGIALLFIFVTGANALAAPANGPLTITFLAVGPAGQPTQGEAILIRTPDHKTALIDGGLDAVSLAQQLDSRLPSWQRSLDIVLLTTPRPDSIGGLQDIVTRYQIGKVLDAGMLHPNVTYATWRHMITQRHIPYQSVSQGTSIVLGAQVVLQVLWPMQPLHKGGDEERNNALILRLVSPGLSVLFLGAAVESTYALSTARSRIDTNYFSAQIVHMVGRVGKNFPAELTDVLRLAHPAWLVVTPAALSAKQRHMPGITTQLSTTGVLADMTNTANASWQVFQTAQVGSVEVSSDGVRWNISPV